ncbi:MAG: hypothetical protein AAGK21_06355 [Bacteroidota bacterium]
MPLVDVAGAPDLAAQLASLSCRLPVLVVGGPVADRVDRATAAVRDGAHVLLAWPPAPSADEADRLVRQAEEAGVEVGVMRPLGASGALAGLPDFRLVTVSLVAPVNSRLAAAGWQLALAGVIDVCMSLTGGRSASRLDVVGTRDGDALRAAALAARFDTGAYAQATIRYSERAEAESVAVYAARPGDEVEAASLAAPLGEAADAALLADPDIAETAAFVAALDDGHRAPLPLHQALATLRLVQRAERQLA